MELLMKIIQDVILGAVQGVTEFLPVSSSGHLNIAKHIMGIDDGGIFLDVMLHIGTLAAVLIFYRKLIWRLIRRSACSLRTFLQANSSGLKWTATGILSLC